MIEIRTPLKTVGHNVEQIHNKIGRSLRAEAALFAMEKDLHQGQPALES